jgi:hypothetical protein
LEVAEDVFEVIAVMQVCSSKTQQF